ncbi:MAG: ornithine carbamoyltransferase [Candidatus Thermoplasmatota archaeon]
MKTMLRGKNFVSHEEWDNEELETVMEVAKNLKMKYALNEKHEYLKNKTFFMLFFDPSTRTRNSFEAGMTQLGGHAHDLTPEKLQITHGETAKDTAEVLSRYGHGIGIRYCKYGEGNKYIREVAKYSRIPVINMQCDILHPCQALADLFTIKEKFREKIEGKKFVISWAYTQAYTKPLSVPQSLILLIPRFGMDVTLAYPKEFKLMPDIIEKAKENAKEYGVKFEVLNDMAQAFENANVVYPKSWGCLEFTRDEKKAMSIAKKYKNWLCNKERMELTDKAIYMHCLPADRGYEVTDEVIDSRSSVVNDEAENRLHVQKAIMSLVMR